MYRVTRSVVAVLGVVLPGALLSGGEVPQFRRGDANLDGRINLSDVSYLVNALFNGGSRPRCLDAADTDDDGKVSSRDPVYLIDWLFPRPSTSPPPPPPPFKTPGTDPTADAITCLDPVIIPPGKPKPGYKLVLRAPAKISRGQKGVEVFVLATTAAAIDGFSIALLVDREAVRLSRADLQGTIFPKDQQAEFETSDFFRVSVAPGGGAAVDLLHVGAVFVDSSFLRLRFAATTGPVAAAPLLRLVFDVEDDAPPGIRDILQNAASLPPDLSGPITEFTGLGATEEADVTTFSWSGPVEAGEFILRADANMDSALDIADPVATLEFLFLGGTPLSCHDAADSNDDGSVDISDPVYTLDFLFTGGLPPAAPYPACGLDITPDALPFCNRSCSR